MFKINISTNKNNVDNGIIVCKGNMAFGAKVRICPHNLFTKMHPTCNIDNISVVNAGNAYLNNCIISNLAEGIITFDDVVNNVVDCNVNNTILDQIIAKKTGKNTKIFCAK